MLLFRIAVATELILVHRLKKIGIGVNAAEQIPNPFDLPELFNQWFATFANLFFPILVLIGFLTRLSVLPTLAVTFTGYFVVHWNGSLIERDTPFMYSI